VIESRTGFNVVHHFKHGESIVGLTVFKEWLVVATNEGLYRLNTRDWADEEGGHHVEYTLIPIELVKG